MPLRRDQGGSTFDGIVWLGIDYSDRAGHAVRLVEFKVDQHTYRYITNVPEPSQLPPLTLANSKPDARTLRWHSDLSSSTWAFIEGGRELGYIRPSRRTLIRATDLPDSYAPL